MSTSPRLRCAVYTRKSTDEDWSKSSTPSTHSAKRALPTSPPRWVSAGRSFPTATTMVVSPAARWTALLRSACCMTFATGG